MITVLLCDLGGRERESDGERGRGVITKSMPSLPAAYLSTNIFLTKCMKFLFNLKVKKKSRKVFT